MSYNKLTKRYSQSTRKKISLNLTESAEKAIYCIREKLQERTGEKVTLTEAILKSVTGLPEDIRKQCNYE